MPQPSPDTPIETLAGVLEAVGVGGTPLVVSFRDTLPVHARELMKTLGVVVQIDPNAPILTSVKTNGVSMPTRSELSSDTRRRMRQAYYARADKQHLTEADA